MNQLAYTFNSNSTTRRIVSVGKARQEMLWNGQLPASCGGGDSIILIYLSPRHSHFPLFWQTRNRFVKALNRVGTNLRNIIYNLIINKKTDKLFWSPTYKVVIYIMMIFYYIMMIFYNPTYIDLSYIPKKYTNKI